MVKIGISGSFPWFGPPFPRLAKHMEDLGFESLWTGEHIIIPVDIADPQRHGVPLPSNYRHMPDPFINFASAAAVTTKLVFGLDVCLVTQREPLVLAKAAATLDRLLGGRLIMATGYGWIREESEIMGTPFADRVRKSSEVMRTLKTIWTEDAPSFVGEFVNFPALYSNPKPLQPGGIPLLIGSGMPGIDNGRALRRVAEIADGWLPMMIPPSQLRDDLARLSQLCAEAGRSFDAMDITVVVPAISMGLGTRPEWAYDLPVQDKDALLAGYADSGATRLIIGVEDMVDNSAFKNLEVIAKGLGLS
jgi:probable F420-dependent oxidoreductase